MVKFIARFNPSKASLGCTKPHTAGWRHLAETSNAAHTCRTPSPVTALKEERIHDRLLTSERPGELQRQEAFPHLLTDRVFLVAAQDHCSRGAAPGRQSSGQFLVTCWAAALQSRPGPVECMRPVKDFSICLRGRQHDQRCQMHRRGGGLMAYFTGAA